jgi:uncharacterized protein
VDASTLILAFLLLLIALLYSSVGHGGASGYLAIMALFGVSTAVMRPTALILNIVVAAIAAFKYLKAKRFSLRTFIIFGILSVPCSFIGGAVQLPSHQMKIVIGIVLIISSFAMIFRTYLRNGYMVREVPAPTGLVCGGIIGFLSGLTSIGGGIFLSPILVFFKWSRIRDSSGIAALFILVNSISGLSGQISAGIRVSVNVWPYVAAVTIGGFIGAEVGSRKLNSNAIMLLLFAVLIVAAIKMLLA